MSKQLTANPQGRVDMLLDRLMERYAQSHPNPLVEAAFEQMRPAIRETLESVAGPRTDIGRKARRTLREAQEFREKVKAATKRRALP